MNIAIFSPSQNPYSETFIQAHKHFLKGKVFYYYGTSNIRLEGYPAISSSLERILLKVLKKVFKKPSNYSQVKTISKSLKKHKIEVVLAEYGTHADYILPIIKEAKLPLVVHFHGYDASVKNVVDKHQRYIKVFNYASKVIAVSKKMEQMLLSLGCPKSKLVYNPNAPHPDFLKVKPKFSKKQFIAIGRFTDKKAPYYTLLAFKQVVAKHPDAKLLLAGDGQLLNMCVNLANYLDLNRNVEFLGVVTPTRYRELLTESIAFIQHSITALNGDMEGMPVAILEASAAGLPVVSTIHAGIPDVIIDEKTGYLVPEHDVNGMAENIINILNNIKAAQQLGAAGKSNIQENFTMENHILGIQNTLKNAITNS